MGGSDVLEFIGEAEAPAFHADIFEIDIGVAAGAAFADAGQFISVKLGVAVVDV